MSTDGGVDALDDAARTPLHLAAAHGQEAAAVALLQAGATPAPRDGRRRTPLVLAAANGHERLVMLLAENGGDIAAGDDRGRTALHEAAMGGHLEAVQALLRHKYMGRHPAPKLWLQRDFEQKMAVDLASTAEASAPPAPNCICTDLEVQEVLLQHAMKHASQQQDPRWRLTQMIRVSDQHVVMWKSALQQAVQRIARDPLQAAHDAMEILRRVLLCLCQGSGQDPVRTVAPTAGLSELIQITSPVMPYSLRARIHSIQAHLRE
eukprot:gene3072-3901_t